MITCAEAVRNLWAYLDEALVVTERAGVEEHLGLCRQCCGELEFAQILRDFLADQARTDQLPDEVRERMQRFVENLET